MNAQLNQFSAELPRQAEDVVRNALNLDGLVKDWGGVERLVVGLNGAGSVAVQHDVVLVGKLGTPRQIDVGTE